MSITIFVHVRLCCWKTNLWLQNLQFSLKMTLDSRSKTDPKQMFRNGFHRKFLYHYFSNAAVTVCQPHICSRTCVHEGNILVQAMMIWLLLAYSKIHFPILNKFPSKNTHTHTKAKLMGIVPGLSHMVIKTRRINKVYILVSQLMT